MIKQPSIGLVLGLIATTIIICLLLQQQQLYGRGVAMKVADEELLYLEWQAPGE
jgi:hypothetical protein